MKVLMGDNGISSKPSPYNTTKSRHQKGDKLILTLSPPACTPYIRSRIYYKYFFYENRNNIPFYVTSFLKPMLRGEIQAEQIQKLERECFNPSH